LRKAMHHPSNQGDLEKYFHGNQNIFLDSAWHQTIYHQFVPEWDTALESVGGHTIPCSRRLDIGESLG